MSTQLSIQLYDLNFDKNNDNILINNACFRIKRNKKYYIITTHNYLPIRNNIMMEDQKLKICINCVWNELLVLKENNAQDNLDKYDIYTFNELGTRLPNVGSTLFINTLKTSVTEICFKPFGFIDEYPDIVYIKVSLKKNEDILPGSALYSNNFVLQGIVCFVEDDNIYCLPSYYLNKTFEKENCFKVPSKLEKIGKVNRFNVKDNKIFNPYLGLNMPLDSYFLLENNRTIEAYENDNTEIIKFEYNESNYNLEHKRNLIHDNKYFNLTTSSLHLLNHLYPEYAALLFTEILNNDELVIKRFRIKNDTLDCRST